MRCRLIAGGVAGMVSRASVAPFERMRTMYMVRQADGRSLSMGGGLPAFPARYEGTEVLQ